MRRSETGRYASVIAGGEAVRAFIPAPLPPRPALDLAILQSRLETALLALGRLDSIGTLLPDLHLFLYAYVRKEALLSSQIEGTQSSLSELLLFELDRSPGVPLDDVVEVSNHVAALEHGLRRLRNGFPLSGRLIRESHEVLMRRGRGAEKAPGEFRRSQNWIGGHRPGRASFVPPPPADIADCMADLERFFHARDSSMPLLLRAGLAHLQFETIHPFLDGNGRVGRLLITLMLCDGGLLREPLLYLSLFFKQHREEYYRLLNQVRHTGDWEAWLIFFMDGVAETATGAVTTAGRLLALFREDEQVIRQKGRTIGSTLRVHRSLQERPILSIPEAAARSGLSYPAAAAGMARLEAAGIAREVTGKRRDRIFGYDRYLAILSEGTEPL